MWADVHCHLDQFPNPAQVVEDASGAGVGIILAVSETLGDSVKNLQLAMQHESVYAAIGLHPMKVSVDTAVQVPKILELFDSSKAGRKLACVGEIGLDYKYAVTQAERELQRRVFREFLEFAQERKLPVSVHSREARKDVVKMLDEYDVVADLHWFAGSKELLREVKSAGHYISFGPAVVSYSNYAKKAREIGSDRLLLESDGPVRYAEGVGVPAWMPRVGEKLASVLGVSLDEFETLNERNSREFLGL